LRDILEEVGKSEFKQQIGFDYTAEPSDLAPNKAGKRISKLLYMDLSMGPITEEVVKKKVQAVVDNMLMNPWVQGKVLPSSCLLITC